MNRRQLGAQGRERADDATGEGIDHLGYLALRRVVLAGQCAQVLQIGADIGGGWHKRPVESAAEQTQRQRQIGIVLQPHGAALDRAPQAIGKAETFQAGETAFGNIDRTSGGQQVELLRVAVEDGMQVSALLAQ